LDLVHVKYCGDIRRFVAAVRAQSLVVETYDKLTAVSISYCKACTNNLRDPAWLIRAYPALHFDIQAFGQMREKLLDA
jgi:hypothetical protein